jgi:hypothetical protein
MSVTPLYTYTLYHQCLGVTSGFGKGKLDTGRFLRSPPVTTSNDESPKTLSVPTAGKRYFGLAKNASYAAAARGEIPVIRIGGRLRVPVVALERMLADAGSVKAA